MTDPKRTIGLLRERSVRHAGLHLLPSMTSVPGYSSLSAALQQFPIGTLKIDQSFVRDVAVDSDDMPLHRAHHYRHGEEPEPRGHRRRRRSVRAAANFLRKDMAATTCTGPTVPETPCPRRGCWPFSWVRSVEHRTVPRCAHCRSLGPSARRPSERIKFGHETFPGKIIPPMLSAPGSHPAARSRAAVRAGQLHYLSWQQGGAHQSANGAGKSSLFAAIRGDLGPDRGDIGSSCLG